MAAPLSSIVEGDEWPSYRSIFRRLEKDDEFRQRYDRARAIQAERWADELITLANSLPEDATAEQIAATKLKIDTLKWIIGKPLPKLYGHAPSSSISVTSTTNNFLVVTEERQREIQERTRKLDSRPGAVGGRLGTYRRSNCKRFHKNHVMF
jgi:hypothetical protein